MTMVLIDAIAGGGGLITLPSLLAAGLPVDVDALTRAIDSARNVTKGKLIVVVVPDLGERYISTPLFEHIRD